MTPNYTLDSASDLTQIAYLSSGSYTQGTCTAGTGTGSGTGSLTYSFDQIGRQLSRGGSLYQAVAPAAVTAASVSFNADNQMTTWNSLANLCDGNGNLICSGSTSSTACQGAASQPFTWDARNRLIQAAGAPSLGGAAETYVYDGLSRRQSVSVASASSQANYLYEGLNAVNINTVNTSSGSQIDNQKFFLGLRLDERYAFYDSIQTVSTTLVTDIQNATVELAKESNLSKVVGYSYSLFGSAGAPTATFPNSFRYTGREASDNTGLYYYRARYYNPTWERFVSEDPLGLIAGPNVYAYVGNDPVNAIDPMGLVWFYYQSTGQLTHVDDSTGQVDQTFDGNYSGQGTGLNNSASQNVAGSPDGDGGPIPQGDYTIGQIQASHGSLGRNVMSLTPNGNNNMFGRTGFYMHGDNSSHNNSASEGCIVTSPGTRQAVSNSNAISLQSFRRLRTEI